VNAIEPNPDLNALLNAIRALPPDLVRQVSDFVVALGKKHAGMPIDESDEWSEEDLRDIAAASAQECDRRFPPAS
jgi:hypothetical protein